MFFTVHVTRSMARLRNGYEDDLGKDFEFPRPKATFDIQTPKYY